MATLSLIIAIIGLAAAAAAVIIASKKVVHKETVIEKPTQLPVATNPFVYDEKSKAYWLNGDLHVTGSLSCKDEKKKEE